MLRVSCVRCRACEAVLVKFASGGEGLESVSCCSSSCCCCSCAPLPRRGPVHFSFFFFLFFMFSFFVRFQFAAFGLVLHSSNHPFIHLAGLGNRSQGCQAIYPTAICFSSLHVFFGREEEGQPVLEDFTHHFPPRGPGTPFRHVHPSDLPAGVPVHSEFLLVS